jgi:S1-C subfamily serine protease
MHAFLRALALARVGATTRDGFVELAPQPGPATFRSASSKRYELRPGQFNLARHLRGARFMPATRDGKTIGLKILAVAPGSRLHTLGFARGDTILRIAGWPVTSPADALAVYERVGQASIVDVDILRGDKEMRISCPLV